MVERAGPAIVISASGMATGGRVLHHLANGLADARNTVLFVGFQAAGTRGRQLIEGAQEVKMFGQLIPVHARIEKLNGMSAHADASEIVQWLSTFPAPPDVTYLVHGEPSAQDALKTAPSSTSWPGTCKYPDTAIVSRSRSSARWPVFPNRDAVGYSSSPVRSTRPLPARAGRRRRPRPALRRRLQRPAARPEAAALAPVPGGARRARHLLRPALSPQPRDARLPGGAGAAR